MLKEIKNKIETELAKYAWDLERAYSLDRLAPVLSWGIKDFILRPGKRLRPALFALAYLGFARKPGRHLYKAALSFELLHDFLLVHDDIVDKAATRRGRPSMHQMFAAHLQRCKKVKFNGPDLAILSGDVLLALAIEAFLSVNEERQRKERALSQFIRAAINTGIGEFRELFSGALDIAKISPADIYKIYDYKTAGYTFAAPLSCGATLAGAAPAESAKLYQYGIYLGRAFQLKDDLLGLFGEEDQTGKSGLTDLQEAKKTLPLWAAYHNSGRANQAAIRRVLALTQVKRADLLQIRRIIKISGALDYSKQELANLIEKARKTIESSRMRPKYKAELAAYSQELLTL